MRVTHPGLGVCDPNDLDCFLHGVPVGAEEVVSDVAVPWDNHAAPTHASDGADVGGWVFLDHWEDAVDADGYPCRRFVGYILAHPDYLEAV